MVYTLTNFRYCLLLIFISLFIVPVSAQDKPELDLGGAVRFNYNLSSWKKDQKARGGDFGFDIFRINASGKYKGIIFNAEYRFYTEEFGGGMLKHGWIGYKFNEIDEIQIGQHQVPFGMQRYSSNNWFLNLPFYIGLEDDYDMGIKYIHNGETIEYHLAFYKNSEELLFGNNTESSARRYSYDIAGRNKEVNQFNGKFVYKFGEAHNNRVGISGQYGGLYNLDTKKTGNHFSFAAHYEGTFDLWNLKAQFLSNNRDPKNAAGESTEIVTMVAYNTPYRVASDFNIYSLGISRTLPVTLGPISSLELYNDFGYMQKSNADFEDSYMNVTGVLVTAGKVYTYIDYAAGYNHSWIGGNFVDDFAQGNPDAKWEARFNINIGYYF